MTETTVKVAPILLHLAGGAGFRLDCDYYVRLDTNDYAVDPQVIGRFVEVTADLGRVRVHFPLVILTGS